jgi:protein-disulfide isomerase
MSTQLKKAVNTKDHVQGDSNALIELVEYGDYQCPHCGHAYPIIKAVQEVLGDKLKFVFRNFPLTEVHPDAFNAAVAAEAAAFQNKFWEMHDSIFEHQRDLSWDALFSYAKALGMDMDRFQKDIQDTIAAAKVESDFESGVRSGVNGTPSFYINGKKYEGDWEAQPLLYYLQSLI